MLSTTRNVTLFLRVMRPGLYSRFDIFYDEFIVILHK